MFYLQVKLEIAPEILKICNLRGGSAFQQNPPSGVHSRSANVRPYLKRRNRSVLVHQIVTHLTLEQASKVFFLVVELETCVTREEQFTNGFPDEPVRPFHAKFLCKRHRVLKPGVVPENTAYEVILARLNVIVKGHGIRRDDNLFDIQNLRVPVDAEILG